MYNPTDRLEQALGTQWDGASATPQFHISRVPKCHNQRTGQNEPFPGEPQAAPSHLAGTQRLGGGTGRGGTATVCSWGWNTPLFQGERSVTTLGTAGGSSGLREGVPRLQAPGESSLGLPGAAGRAGSFGALRPQLIRGKGM